MRKAPILASGLCGACLLWVACSARADETWLYAVQISAVVQTNPARITLNWPPDHYGANSYTVYRKAKDATSWGTGVVLSGTATNYVDTNVTVGGTYEYQIKKVATLGYTGYGYIFAGIEAPLMEQRGKMVLMVANTHAATLSNELNRLQMDLVGDGWQVIRHDVASNATPSSVRNLIISDYNADPANVKAVFLFGHVPILQSGNLNYDGHLARPMPADAYYGDVDGDWNSSPGFLPSDVELMIGRVDLADMPGNGSASPWPNEAELLRNYLNKDHQWRHRQTIVPRRALMGNRRGDEQGEATAASGFRNFEPLVGPGTTAMANTDDLSPVSERWMTWLAATNYLWAYGCGGGLPAGISHLGTHGQYNEVWSTDIVDQNARAVFTMFFGSWFGNWDGTDNFMRSILATPTLGLTACMAGRPHWFMHHMGLGETIGYSTKLSMNNSTLYRNQSNFFTRAIFIALMGDPSLRMDPAGPPSGLTGVATGTTVSLKWTASTDSVAGYHVYRANSAAGPYVRLNGSLITGTNYVDVGVTNNPTYMVRAVKLQTTPSGTYFSPSQGVFVDRNALLPVQVAISLVTNGARLTWNSQSGTVYRVEGRTNLQSGVWADLSGGILATNTSTSWTHTNANTGRRFYRVAQ